MRDLFYSGVSIPEPLAEAAGFFFDCSRGAQKKQFGGKSSSASCESSRTHKPNWIPNLFQTFRPEPLDLFYLELRPSNTFVQGRQFFMCKVV